MSGNGSYMAWRSALALAMLMFAVALEDARAQQGGTSTTAAAVTYAAQGWSAADRNTFYTTSQGSRMMPYAWFKALRRLDVDQPFAADKLQRYGYLPNDPSPVSNPDGLPVGFVIDGTAASGHLGMTCAACHTGQLEYRQDGVIRALRLDGAPANVDFQEFLTDLLAASRATLTQPDRLDAFVREVVGPGYTGARATQVKDDFGKWVAQFGEFMDKSLPASPWGPGRLDAFGMIFNRVVARDLGVVDNFKTADAPVSYPFLWNASRQDRTQWNGGVPNGLYIHALGRNTGEVFGVFADFAPRRLVPPTKVSPAVIDYTKNSVKFDGLQTLEEKIAALRPPPWPRDLFGLDKFVGSARQAAVRNPLRQLSRGAVFGRCARRVAHPCPRRRHGREDGTQFGAHVRRRSLERRADAAACDWRQDRQSREGRRPSCQYGGGNLARRGRGPAGTAAGKAGAERRLSRASQGLCKPAGRKSRRAARPEALLQGQGRGDDQNQSLHQCAAEQPV